MPAGHGRRGATEDGSLYAIAAYRLRHGTLPVGWVAMLAQPGWAIKIVLIGVAILIFPDGSGVAAAAPGAVAVPGPRHAWMGTAYVLTPRPSSGTQSGWFRRQPARPRRRTQLAGWWNVLQDAILAALGLSWLLVLAGQLASFRRAAGQRGCN